MCMVSIHMYESVCLHVSMHACVLGLVSSHFIFIAKFLAQKIYIRSVYSNRVVISVCMKLWLCGKLLFCLKRFTVVCDGPKDYSYDRDYSA